MRYLPAILLVLFAAAITFVVLDRVAPKRVLPPPARHAVPPKPVVPVRPPQFVVVGFDGSGGAQMWSYWRSVARQARARFTFFASGVYLVDWAHRTRYHPPRHTVGSSAIGFGQETGDLTVAKTLSGIAAGYRDGHEIGTHYNGHFCSPEPGSVGGWSAADWQSELEQFDKLLFHSGVKLPFGPGEVVGGRTPCLEGKLSVLYPVLARNGFRYDASQTVALGTWPRRERGIWSFPLIEMPFIGHTFRVVSMDYNFFANQVDESSARAENETYRSLWNAFLASYGHNRAPLTIGQHFETWNSWAYDRALKRFLLRACRMPEVRCTSYRELANFLDSVPAARLRRYKAGRFPPPTLRTVLNRR